MNEEKKNLKDEERKELKENLKNQIDEMSDEELDQVAGGLIVDCGDLYDYRIVDDKTGEIIDRWWRKKDAVNCAKENGVSDNIISKEEYKKRFGRDIDLSK